GMSCMTVSSDSARLHLFPTRRPSDLPAVPLPLQRSEEETAEGEGDEAVTIDGTVAGVGTPSTATVEGVRRMALTERELQVLRGIDRKSTRLNSSHVKTSYAVSSLKKK